MKAFLIVVLLGLAGVLQAAPAGVFRADAKVPMSRAYPAVLKALEDANFWAVFEANIGNSLAGFADKWGADYNRNGLDGIRAIVVCNGWYANAVSNADPDLLALCPLRVNLVENDGSTRVLFARPSVIAAGSPGDAPASVTKQAPRRSISPASSSISSRFALTSSVRRMERRGDTR